MNKYILGNKVFNGDKFLKGTYVIQISGSRISKISKLDDGSVEKFIKDNPRVQDFRGRWITPGLIDCHNHYAGSALGLRFTLDFGECRNFADIRDTIRSNSSRIRRGWLVGYNINEYDLSEGRLPTAKELDEMCPKHPLFILHTTGHYGICNTTALRMAGIEANTKVPVGSRIGHYEDGQPNGILYEPGAMDLLTRHIPGYTFGDFEDALKYAGKLFREKGLTTVKDIGGAGNDMDETLRIESYNRLSKSHRLPVRVGISVPIFSLSEVHRKVKLYKLIEKNEFLKFTGFKLFLDGSGISRTAWLSEEWNKNFNDKDTDNYGSPVWKISDFFEVISILNELDAVVSIHTIGDKAISTAIEAIKQAGPGKARYALVHVYNPPEGILKDLLHLNVTVETQSSFIYFLGDAIMSNFGFKRVASLFPLKRMMEEGINICNSSDWNVTTFDPIYGLVSSMDRKTKGGREFNPKQSLNLEEALRAYTSNASKILGWPEIGYIREGNFADIIIWKHIPLSFEEFKSETHYVEKVIFNGE